MLINMFRQLFILTFVILLVRTKDEDYYEVLGVDKKATQPQIRQAYKKLAVKLHPDKNPNEKEQQLFLKITEAYETLKDVEKRRRYDQYGIYHSYSRQYDARSQKEQNQMFYNGLYHNDLFVATLEPNSYYEFFVDDGLYFINLYSPFCPPCQKLAEHWKRLAQLYTGIVRVGAVNCKYHSSFCYHNIGINSYPTLLFYPNGKNGRFIEYDGDRSIEDLDQFLANRLRRHGNQNNKFKVYILSPNIFGNPAITRIAYRLRDVASVSIIKSDERDKFTSSVVVTAVCSSDRTDHQLMAQDEADLLKQILQVMPPTHEILNPQTFKVIRDLLREGKSKPLIIYFHSSDVDLEMILRINSQFTTHNIGTLNCISYSTLCYSLGALSGWGILKVGGAYVRVSETDDIPLALRANNMQSLSDNELNRILHGDMNTNIWVILLSWDKKPFALEPFTRLAEDYLQIRNVQFGLALCSSRSVSVCSRSGSERVLVLIPDRNYSHKQYLFEKDPLEYEQMREFVEILVDDLVKVLTEEELVAIASESERKESWFVGLIPAECDIDCQMVAHYFRMAAYKLRDVQGLVVGMSIGSKTPQGWFYPNDRQNRMFAVGLAQLGEWAKMCEWVLSQINSPVKKIDGDTHNQLVYQRGELKPMLVYYHSPKCHHCHEMFPEYLYVVQAVSNEVSCYSIDCSRWRQACSSANIERYPSLGVYSHKERNIISLRERDLLLRDVLSLFKATSPHLLHNINNNQRLTGAYSHKDEL